MQTETFGTLESAKLIYNFHKNNDIPDGWEEIGHNGTCRYVYRSPDNFVYKICKHDGNTENLEELESYQKILSQKISYKSWKVAPVSCFVLEDKKHDIVINVMPFIEGEHEDIEGNYDDEVEIETAFSMFGLYDAHDGNYIVTKDREYIIIDITG